MLKKKLNYIDLFCGIGGFHQALDKLNYKCVFACDSDKHCQDNYKINYGIKPHDNVKTITKELIKENVDIICGGFPCQSFSNAGKKLSFNDDRGLLFDEIVRIAKFTNPMFIFLENVKHILKVDNGNVFKYIKNKIESLNYNFQYFKISPNEYGIPQNRERIYFVCVRNDIYNGKKINLIENNKKIELNNYLENIENIDRKYFIKSDILDCLNAWDELIKKFNINEKISPTLLINDYYRRYSDDDIKNFPFYKKNYLEKNKLLIRKYQKDFDEWYNKYNIILNKREIYGKLEWQVGPITKNDSIFNYFIQIRQSGIRVKKSDYFPTLVAISQIPIYGKEKRYITPRECARLQSFPDKYILSDNDKISYKQLGNAINVDNAYLVIKSTLLNY